MKKLICLTLAALIASCVFAQTKIGEHEWNIKLHILDESGIPVAGANAGVGFFTNSTPTGIDGITDTNGDFVATHSDTPSESAYPLSFRIEKQGYYSTWAQVDLGQGYDPTKWSQSVTLTLKKVGKPIAMYSKWIRKNPSVLNQPMGYDLMVGDWVGPNGSGVQTDVIFQADEHVKSNRDYEHNITIKFPKPGDGIQVYNIPDSEATSGLRSPHEAPTNGYQPELTRETSAHPGQPNKFEYDPNRIYLFRVRTALDQQGNVVSAHYGKIYGDFMQFTYYLNPTPNDRNMEFDLKQNLLQGLQSFEGVNAP